MNKEELQAEEKALREQLSINIEKQKQISISEFHATYGVKQGDTIEFMDGRKVCRGVVKDFNFFGGQSIWKLLVNLLKKDGTEGSLRTSIFPEAKIKLIKSATNE